MKVLGTKSLDVYTKNIDMTLPSSYEMEMTVTGFNSGWNTDICLEDMFFNRAQNGTIRKISRSTMDYVTNFGTYEVGTVLKFVRDGNNKTIEIYFDDVFKKKITDINSNGKQQFKTYNGRYIIIKDLKIHEL